MILKDIYINLTQIEALPVKAGGGGGRLTLFRLGFFGQSVTGGGSSDPPSVSLEPIMLGS